MANWAVSKTESAILISHNIYIKGVSCPGVLLALIVATSMQDVGTLETYNRAMEKIREAGEKTEASYETTHSGERGK